MIGKITDPRGKRVEPLIYYLYGPGRREEHTDPHIVAGWRHPAELEPPQRPGGQRDFRRLNGLLNQPHTALGTWGFDRPVWHCAVRAAPGDRMLSDDEWAQIAGDIMHRTGLSPYGQEDDAVRWVAIRHGDDHIHIVAMLARQDGRRPRTSNERYLVRAACRTAEDRYGLRRTAPGDRTAARRPTRAETEKAGRRGWREPARVTLKRHVSTAAAAAATEREFFARLRQAGVLVRARLSTRNPGQITGYAVALPADTTKAGGPVWYGGAKLAADLTLPKLRLRWPGTPRQSAGVPRGQLSWAERDAIWQHAARTATVAGGQIRQLTAADPAAAADAAWAASDTLHAAAAALGSRAVRQAADAYDRAARAPYGRIPHATRPGASLRHAARMLSALGVVTHDPSLMAITLVIRLAALADAVADLRHVQQHAAQAAAAKTAAERLRFLARPRTEPPPRGPAPTRPRIAPGLARTSFPVPAVPQQARAATDDRPRATPPASPPRPRPAPPRPRGPIP